MDLKPYAICQHYDNAINGLFYKNEPTNNTVAAQHLNCAFEAVTQLVTEVLYNMNKKHPHSHVVKEATEYMKDQYKIMHRFIDALGQWPAIEFKDAMFFANKQRDELK